MKTSEEAKPSMPKLIDIELKTKLDDYIGNAIYNVMVPPPPLDEYIQSFKGLSFHETLWDIISKSKLTEVEIYERAGISKSKFSRIRSDNHYKPDKITAVSLVFALELDISTAERLLKSASIVLSSSSKFDLIIRYFLEQGDTDAFHVNDALFTYKEPLICGITE